MKAASASTAPLRAGSAQLGKGAQQSNILVRRQPFSCLGCGPNLGVTSNCRTSRSQAGMTVEATVLEAKVIDIVVPTRLSIGQHTVRLTEQLEDGMGGLSS